MSGLGRSRRAGFEAGHYRRLIVDYTEFPGQPGQAADGGINHLALDQTTYGCGDITGHAIRPI